jgi:hypothetical protein
MLSGPVSWHCHKERGFNMETVGPWDYPDPPDDTDDEDDQWEVIRLNWLIDEEIERERLQ